MSQATMTRPDSTERRRRHFVDTKVQGALLRQAVQYWLSASVTFALIVFVYRVFPALLTEAGQGSGRMWYHLGPFVVASAVLFPIVLWNTIRSSNRFVGPMVRVRKALQQLAQGETLPPLVLRDHDFWPEIANDINDIAARLDQAPSSACATKSSEHEVSGSGKAPADSHELELKTLTV